MIGLFVAGWVALSAMVGVLEVSGYDDKSKSDKLAPVISIEKEKKHYYIRKSYTIVTKKTIERE